ncbi:MAG: DNA-methyltransferase, partial [Promethearchaeota archaeon]
MARKRKYIPHLAEFFFEPKHKWSVDDARKMWEEEMGNGIDTIQYIDCVMGMRSMPKESVDLVVADPPFGIDFSGKENIYNRDASMVIDDYKEVIDDYAAFSRAWIKELPRLMKRTASAFIVSGWTNLKDVLVAIDEVRLHLINHVIWKYQFGPFASRKWVSSHYHVLFVVKDPKKYFYHRITHYNLDVWDDLPRTYKAKQKKNGTKLPEALVARFIDFCTKPGDLVLDPFMGNGTTAVTAKL